MMSIWKSKETIKNITTYTDLEYGDGTLYYLRTSADEKGFFLASYNLVNKNFIEHKHIKPSSVLYEYGGKSYCIHNNFCYYSCSKRSSLLSSNLLTRKEETLCDNGIFCCPVYTSQGIFFLEDKISTNNQSYICFYSFKDEKKYIMFSGYKYTSAISINQNEDKIAWVCGNSMPWDKTYLYKADIIEDKLVNIQSTHVNNSSFSDPQWDEEDNLYCINDKSNWWNIYRVTPQMDIIALLATDNEYTKPSWLQGKINYSVNNGIITCNYLENSYSKVIKYNIQTKEKNIILNQDCYVHEIISLKNENKVALSISSPLKASDLLVYDCKSFISISLDKPNIFFKSDDISIPESIKNDNGINKVHSLFYPPVGGLNDNSCLLLKIHGGPTSMSYPALDPKIQFWTSMNFAVLDVNYSGSSGFGRSYRDSLYGKWGIIDVNDCIAALQNIIVLKGINPERVFARGSSAGGFTILNIAAQSNLIKKLSCYYGVTNLKTLVGADEPSLESSYLKSLVGENTDINTLSPINKSHRIKSNVIFFQGLKDKVVPPEQSEAMYKTMDDNGIYCEYHTYENEGHSFKNPDSIIDCLDKELKFFLSNNQ